jgi:hypothetical protein
MRAALHWQPCAKNSKDAAQRRAASRDARHPGAIRASPPASLPLQCREPLQRTETRLRNCSTWRILSVP